jgi:hypothetical protein
MASKKDALPYGARWGFRTPSPDFARTAVEPLSPLPASASPYVARTSSFSSSYAPPPVLSYSPQYSAVSRSFRGADPAPQPPQPSYAHGYMISSPADRQLPKLQTNPLDALADIALMHGARLATGPAYNPPPLPMPTMIPPTFVAASVPTSTWPRPDSAQPQLSPQAREVPYIHAEQRRSSFSADHRDASYSFGTIGQERRSVSRGRDHGSLSNVDEVPPALSRSSPIAAMPLPAMQPAPPAAAEAPAQATADDPLSVPKTEESRHHWINASPKDEYIPHPEEADIHEHSITVSRPQMTAQPVQNSEDGALDADFGKSGTVSLPTPTQDDHVIAGSESPAEEVAFVQEVPELQDSVANRTPEITETEIPTKAAVTAEEPPTKDVDALEATRQDELMVEAPPLVKAGELFCPIYPSTSLMNRL